MRRTLLITFLILFSYRSVDARTEVNKSLDLLKANMENSEANFEQFEKNKKISARNATETRKAMDELKNLEMNLLNNSENIEKNKGLLDKMKGQIQGYKKAELAELEKEKKYIAEVQKLLKKLQDNKKQREMNIAAYDAKMLEIEREKKDWDLQRGALTDLQREIQSKYQQASKANSEWRAKEMSYSKEANKWHKQALNAKETYLKYKHLAEK